MKSVSLPAYEFEQRIIKGYDLKESFVKTQRTLWWKETNKSHDKETSKEE